LIANTRYDLINTRIEHIIGLSEYTGVTMREHQFKQQILFIRDVEEIIGRNRLTLRRWWVTGKFPKPVKLNNSVLSWHYDVIEQWIHQNLYLNN